MTGYSLEEWRFLDFEQVLLAKILARDTTIFGCKLRITGIFCLSVASGADVILNAPKAPILMSIHPCLPERFVTL